MLGSIRKFSKSFVAKIFIAIIALPFIMWGMGDVFRSGTQNVLVEINNEKISSKEFIEYLQKINLTQEEIKNLGKSKLLDKILTNYISEKIMKTEGEKKGIQLSDTGLSKIILGDKEFKKNDTFSRVKYEKFLLKNNYSAPTYERHLRNLELKGQLLTYYSGGIRLPKFIVNDLYKKEKHIKEIEFIDLNEIYSKKVISKEAIKKFYEENKNLFNEKFVSFKYLKLTPETLTQKKDFDEEYYKKLGKIENDILDGKDFDSITSESRKQVKSIDLINSRKTKQDGTVMEKIDDDLLKEIFLTKEKNLAQFIDLNNKYYIVEILDEKNITLTLKDKDLKRTIESQLKIRFKIEENTKIAEKINEKKFNEKEMLELSKKNNVLINKTRISGINDKKKFAPELLKKIYNHNAGEIFVLFDNILQENFLIKILKEMEPSINDESEDYKKYVKRANAEYISKIYKSYDKYINANYKIDVNEKVFERLKNSF